MSEDGETTPIEQARIDVHHSAEQVAHIRYLVIEKQKELDYLREEQAKIEAQFHEKAIHLVLLRNERTA